MENNIPESRLEKFVFNVVGRPSNNLSEFDCI